MKVYITKWALTEGIMEKEAEVNPDFPTFASVNGYVVAFHGEGREWHRTRESAVEQAEKMRKRKILSLKNQLDRLEKLTFE